MGEMLTLYAVLKKLSDPFIDGFIELVGGEKDPRNLMIVFSLLKVITIEFDTERHTEVYLPPQLESGSHFDLSRPYLKHVTFITLSHSPRPPTTHMESQHRT